MVYFGIFLSMFRSGQFLDIAILSQGGEIKWLNLYVVIANVVIANSIMDGIIHDHS